MKIWVDADACPVVIKDILFKAADKRAISTTFLANHSIRVPPSRFINFMQVSSGFDVADDEIVKRVSQGDLVITSDIPLASDAISKGALALSPRGELFTIENIKSRLNIRDFMDTMRASGVQTGGPAALNQQDRQNFANHLDKIITKHQQS
ncbi:YaiI/YqxD family protein [Colwellia sp. RSH04]|uniref:YaiI/YqxD family protein n=1 Tax=Colwellia sp. RSH04 TaxID=2305464 RepID=UPI000E59195C|nr:YaiI/YqxD family protein [Colwellia sp. RSH04]RHW75412.1 YaiI/YqxD family protein [Colwellia sp. RSH04]